eukprot:scaffold23618_cov90-Isochrysis_galbana.AAC.2
MRACHSHHSCRASLGAWHEIGVGLAYLSAVIPPPCHTGLPSCGRHHAQLPSPLLDPGARGSIACSSSRSAPAPERPSMLPPPP